MKQGHNDLLFEARQSLSQLEAGEKQVREAWLRYGAALNQGRALFPGSGGDLKFGQWLVLNKLHRTPNHRKIGDKERAAAMWAAANHEQLAEMQEAFPSIHSLRGLHKKWRERDRIIQYVGRAKEALSRIRAAEAKKQKDLIQLGRMILSYTPEQQALAKEALGGGAEFWDEALRLAREYP